MNRTRSHMFSFFLRLPLGSGNDESADGAGSGRVGNADWATDSTRRNSYANSVCSQHVDSRRRNVVEERHLSSRTEVRSREGNERTNWGVARAEAGDCRCEERHYIGTIAVGCALWYMDVRFADLGWRDRSPRVASWYAAFSQRPSMQASWAL